MIIRYNTFSELLRNVYGNKKPNINIDQVRGKKLVPETDIDGNPVVYQVRDKRQQLVDSITKDDCFERMSFEKGTDIDDEEYVSQDIFFRDIESVGKNEYSPVIHKYQYSEEDVGVAESLVRKYNCAQRDNNTESLDTDFDYDSRRKLKYFYLKRQAIPHSIPRKLNVSEDTIEKYANIAMNAIDNGTTISEIPGFVQRSIINDFTKYEDVSIELFDFLIKYPNKRHLVVNKDKNGIEFVDKTAIEYLPKLESRVDDPNEVGKILPLCKLKNNEGKNAADSDLCKMAMLLLLKEVTKNEEPLFCWRKEYTQVMNWIKSDKSINNERYMLVWNMLQKLDICVDTVLENLGNIQQGISVIDKVVEKLNSHITNEDKKQKLESSLLNAYSTYLVNKQFNVDKNDYLHFLQSYVLEQNLAPDELENNISALIEIKNKYGSNKQLFPKVVQLCAEEENGKILINKKVFKILDIICAKDGKLDKNKQSLIEKLKTVKVEKKAEFYKSVYDSFYWIPSKEHPYMINKMLSVLNKTETDEENNANKVVRKNPYTQEIDQLVKDMIDYIGKENL